MKLDDYSSKETFFYADGKYKGAPIREYISVQRGFREIICVIEGEHLDESRVEGEGGEVSVHV